jgi:hypothetical protein
MLIIRIFLKCWYWFNFSSSWQETIGKIESLLSNIPVDSIPLKLTMDRWARHINQPANTCTLNTFFNHVSNNYVIIDMNPIYTGRKKDGATRHFGTVPYLSVPLRVPVADFVFICFVYMANFNCVPCPGFVRVLESLGKFWKLIMDFSRTLKFFENGFLVH